MYIAYVTNEYDKITSSTYTDYDIVTSSNYTDYDMTITTCSNNEKNIDIFIPSFLLTIECGLSFLCLMSLMVYALNKPLFNNK